MKGPAIVIILFLISGSVNGLTDSDTTLVNRQIRSGFKFLSQKGKISEVKACIDSATNICERKNLDTPALLNLLRAEHALVISDFRGSSVFAEGALKKAKEEGDDVVHAKVLSFFGNFFLRTGSFQQSLDFFENSISVAKKAGIKGIIPRALDGEAQVYVTIGELKTYQLYLQKMIEASNIEKDTFSISRGLFLLGSVYAERLRDPKKCDSILRKCYTLSKIAGDSLHMALSQANMGWNFYLGKMYDSSITCYNRSLRASVPAKIYSTAANAYGNLGTIYRDINNPAKSLDYYNKSIDIALKADDWRSLDWVYLDMSQLYLREKDTAKAYFAFVNHKKYSDQYIKKNNIQGLSDAKMRFDIESHNREVELLSLKIKNQRFLMYGSAVLAVLAVAVSLLLYRGSRLKARRRISEMNRTISELTQANLRQQMNPHFIFNTLNSIQYYMYQHDKLATNNYLTKFTSLMRKVLENSQHTSVTIKDELEALNLYLELETLRFKERFEYQINVDEEIDPLLFKIPTMLIQPYVENSICHGMMPGESKGLLKIDLKLEKDHIACIIEDNGIGREAAQKRKSTQGNNHNSLGTLIVASRLDLVNSLYGTSLKTIYTDLKDSKGEPTGTRVEIHIPIIS